MKRRALISMFSMICASLLLAGCSYFDTSAPEDLDVTVKPSALAETIDLTISQPDLFEDEAPASDSVEVFSLADYAGPVSGGEVDLIDEDGNYIPAGHFGDPSVDVYPLDEAMRGLMSAGYVEAQQRLYPSPFTPVTPEQEEPPEPPVFAQARPQPTQISAGALNPAAPEGDAVQTFSLDAPPEYVTISQPGGQSLKIFFGHGAVQPSAEYNGVISQVARGFAPAPNRFLSIEGHASQRANTSDETQRRIINLKVSMMRAFNVARKLMEQGVAQDSIRVVGWGESLAASTASGADGEAAARRVEILQAQ